MELHNAFNMYKERSGENLESLIRTAKKDDKKKPYEVALNFYNKYDWSVGWNLVRILEKDV